MTFYFVISTEGRNLKEPFKISQSLRSFEMTGEKNPYALLLTPYSLLLTPYSLLFHQLTSSSAHQLLFSSLLTPHSSPDTPNEEFRRTPFIKKSRCCTHILFIFNPFITSAIKYGHIGDFVIYSIHGKDRWTHT